MRFHRVIAAVMLCCSVAFLVSCMPPPAMPREQDFSRLGDEKIVRLVLKSGEVIRFDFIGAKYYARYKNKLRVIVGKTEDGRVTEFDRNNVLRVYTARDFNQETLGQAFFPTLFILGVLVVVASGAS